MTGKERRAGAGLETFINAAVAASNKAGYHATRFNDMRSCLGTIQAISRLLQSGDIQSGLIRMHKLGMIDKTIESAVLAFDNEFTADEKQATKWRLDQVRTGQY